ncbi:acyl-CoA dehydrogenase family protein [Gaopeijia maritima]|uniref:Acyl-CoA dehydrogenase family protein n=1 Tax=Gaopeijia maritima TaxID=3119007 RepID=A0ABU9E620_9BACT
MPDLATIAAFLDLHHGEWAARVADFADTRLRPRPRARDDDDGRREAVELVRLMGDAGLYRPLADMDYRAAALARETIAVASPLADALYAIQGLCLTPLLIAGTESQRERYRAGLLSGDLVGGFAMTEPEAGSDVAAMRTTARREGDDYLLNGRKHLISNAGIADLYMVFAATDPAAGSRGITCFAVPADTPGLHFAGAQVLSAPHPLGELAFQDCRVPGSAVVGESGAGFKIGMATLDRLRLTVAAAACGMAERALDEALAHATTRRQFGQALADFQVIQTKIGAMAMELAAARLLVYQAAHTRDGGAERVTLEAARAKAFATEAAQRIVDEAVQILGGRGVLADSPVDYLYRAVRALRIYEGTTEIQYLIIARQVIGAHGGTA